MLEFKNSEPFTIGVELEFQLLEREDLSLVSSSPEVLKMIPEGLKERVKQEFIRSMVEVTTGVCSNMAQVERELAEACGLVEEIAEKRGLTIYASSLHPFSKYRDQRLFDDSRYLAIMEELQLLGRRLITQGLHVHIGMSSGDQAIKVFDAIRRYLPILLALTASSPFFQGEDTGLQSYRTKLFSALPRSGMPGTLVRWQGFVQLVNTLTDAGIIDDVRELWWDVRPHPYFGTIEIRICDLPSRFDEILGVAALVQALVAWLAESPPSPPPFWYLIKGNKWQATRYGLRGRFVDPVGRSMISMKAALIELIKNVSPYAKRLGGLPYLMALERVLKQGSSADRQRCIFNERGDFRAMIKKMKSCFWKRESKW